MPHLYPELRLITLAGDENFYKLEEGGYYKNIWGNEGSDTLEGNASDNVLNGDAGDDTMIGGAGNDTYGVYDPGDVIVELAGGGTDLVMSTIDFTLPDFVENLILRDGSVRGTGNSLNNLIVGHAGDNSLYGDAGDDTLDGGGGLDYLDGGLGNDTYIVDSADDVIFEGETGGGIDTVLSSISYSIADQPNLENITLTAPDIADAPPVTATGNDLANVLIGSVGANQLFGSGGNDRLNGGLGQDTLSGGTGRDIFVFDTKLSATNIDRIVDFNSADDTLYLENAIFTKLGKAGKLKSDYFRLGTKALDANDYLIYNTKNDTLYYDKDGSGRGAAVKIAEFNNIKLALSDFIVI